MIVTSPKLNWRLVMPLIKPDTIKDIIFTIRGQNVILDSDLAELYEVETRILNRNVKRNIEKFPKDFMFKLTKIEWENLRSQIGISSKYGGRRYTPLVFTEYGIAALSGILNSSVAVNVNITIIREFVNLRKRQSSDAELAERVSSLESDSKEAKQIFQIMFNKLNKIEREVPLLPKDRKKIGLK
jgi:hypothetical protein